MMPDDEPNRGRTLSLSCSLHGETALDYLSARQNAIGLKCGCAWLYEQPSGRAVLPTPPHLVAVEYHDGYMVNEGGRPRSTRGFVPVPEERLD